MRRFTRSGAPVTLVCRCNPRAAWIVAMCVFLAAMFAVTPWLPNDRGHAPTPPWQIGLICWPFAALIGAGAIWLGFDLVRGEVRADAAGLMWRRGWGAWKSALWGEIRDFYWPQLGAPTRVHRNRRGQTGTGIHVFPGRRTRRSGRGARAQRAPPNLGRARRSARRNLGAEPGGVVEIPEMVGARADRQPDFSGAGDARSRAHRFGSRRVFGRAAPRRFRCATRRFLGRVGAGTWRHFWCWRRWCCRWRRA